MKFGFVLPYGDARPAAELARLAEQSGWDGFFVWDPVWGVDAWVALTAAAMLTERIHLGTMITPISRRRPWKLASETATLDRLSNGRLILATGLGATDTGFEAFGEVTDRQTRSELLDEGLAILDGLWRGQPFNFQGKHYSVKETNFYPPPPPVQQPRIPVWVVGAWPRPKSMQRVTRWDGLLPVRMHPDRREILELRPHDVEEMASWIKVHRELESPFDIVVEGSTPADDPATAATKVKSWAQAGATWWIESMWDNTDPAQVARRLHQGPPVA